MEVAGQFIDALGIQGGNLVLGEAGGMEAGDSGLDLADTVSFANLDKAKLFRERNTVRDWTEDGRYIEYSV